MSSDTMEQYIETLIAAGVDRERIVRARHRGTAYQCLECEKVGVRTINIKCRMEDHFMRKHMSEDAIPFKCRLCGFMCLRKDQILSHTTGYTRHLVAAVKQKVTNSLPYLMESRQPHVFGASDFKALTPEASLLHFLGSGDSELEQKVVAPAAAKQVMEVTQSAIYRPLEMSRVEDTFAPLVPQAANHSALATPRLPPPTAVPDAFPGVSLQQAGEEPSAGSIISIPEEQRTDIASQLTAFLQGMAGIVQSPFMLSGMESHLMHPPAEMSQLPLSGEEPQGLASQPPPIPSSTGLEGNVIGGGPKSVEPVVQSVGLNATTPAASSRETERIEQQVNLTENEMSVYQANSDRSETCEITEQRKGSGEGKQNTGELMSDKVGETVGTGIKERSGNDSDLDGECPLYIPTPIDSTDTNNDAQESESPIPREGDVLEITDEDMSIATPVKRAREESEVEPVQKKKAKEDTKLLVDIKGLSERTLVQIVDEALKTAERNLAVNEQMRKAIVDSTCVQSKLADAVNRLTSTVMDFNREERRREERRRAFEQRWEDEWRHEWNRRRDDNRREERRRESERKERKETKENQRPQSVLGRVYTKDTISDANRRS